MAEPMSLVANEATAANASAVATLPADHVFRAFVERLKDGAATLAPDATVVWANARVAQLVGMPLEEVIGSPLMKIVHPGDQQKLGRLLRLGARRSATRQLRLRRRDGEPVTVEMRVAPVEAQGSPLLTVVIVDLTLHMRREAELKQSTAALARLNATLDQRVRARSAEVEAFAYSVSHDLRVPLRAIGGFARILAERVGDDPESERHVGVIIDHARQMSLLIDDLLDYASIGRTPLKLEEVAPAEIARAAWNDLAYERGYREIEFTVADMPSCRADARLLRRVFANLLSNAVKFTRRVNHAVIDVGYRGGDEPAYFVSDNGIGLDMAHAQDIFVMFHRLHRVDEYEGTGVGLAIVDRIVGEHGGRVWVEAEPGLGATFVFTHPCT